MSSLADRIRGIVGTTNPAAPIPHQTESQIPNPVPRQARDALSQPKGESLDLSSLGGDWRDQGQGPCFVVETRLPPESSHGRERVGDVAARVRSGAADAPIVAGGAPARTPFVFVDLETTGLSGGAGTYAFLVGCGGFDEGGAFVSRQYVLTRFADERPLLAGVAGELARAGALVSFNGKSFDAPVLETRYLFHRLAWVGAAVPHVDVLHPARRFWKEDDCSLVALERQILGAHRTGDVPGSEIPDRYFRFLRSGDARPLAAVLAHNRLDLLSLAALTARLLDLVGAGAAAARDAREAFALGCMYSRAGLEARARDAYAHALASAGARSGGSIERTGESIEPLKIACLRALALSLRRARQFDDAVRYWRRLVEVAACPPHVAREANEALAIHHEHRLRDLAAAKAFALQSLENGRQPAWADAVRYRVARIERKMASEPSFWSSSPSPPSCGSPTSGRRTSS